MTKNNRIKQVMEVHNVHYTDRPRTIYQFIMQGYSINDIRITRIDGCHYNMFAIKDI